MACEKYILTRMAFSNSEKVSISFSSVGGERRGDNVWQYSNGMVMKGVSEDEWNDSTEYGVDKHACSARTHACMCMKLRKFCTLHAIDHSWGNGQIRVCRENVLPFAPSKGVLPTTSEIIWRTNVLTRGPCVPCVEHVLASPRFCWQAAGRRAPGGRTW